MKTPTRFAAGSFVVLRLVILIVTAVIGEPYANVNAAGATGAADVQDVQTGVTDPSNGGDAETGQQEQGLASQSPPADGQDDWISVKLIPDQKAFIGSPDTVIDLNGIFEGTAVARIGGPLTMEVLRSKEDVAEAAIEGDLLRLKWGNKTGKTREVLVRATNSDGAYLDTKFNVELWEPDYWKLVLTVIGGLGIFLLGMKHMSEGLQAVAGNRLRRMISVVTDNRLMATGMGVLVTMLVQSSSITTVMAVGFVNSGFMTLTQSVGVIMGANIGTTITGWILVLKIGKYGLPLAGAAAFVYLFAKRDRWRYTALACMGLGMIFLGLELMKDGFGIIKELPEFEAWFRAFQADSYGGVLKCALVGCVLTFVVQSSSATLGITIGLAQIGVIEFQTAAALVLGENIGTTITAWLASFGANANAKRAAYFHVLFNMLGVAWITAVFPWYLMLVRYVVTGDSSASMSLGDVNGAEITAAIAATHTGFNVTNTIVFLPLAGLLATLLQRIVPDKSTEEEGTHLTNLDIRMLESPAIAIEQSHAEVLRMADDCEKMIGGLKQVLTSEVPDAKLMKTILQWEDDQDTVQHEIVTFMSDLLAANVPHEIIDEARIQLRIADEYESVSDCIATVLKSHRRLYREGMRMAEEERAEILHLHDTVAEFLSLVTRGYAQRRSDSFDDAIAEGESITRHAKAMAKQILAKMPDERLAPQITVAYNRQVSAYRRVRDHLVNIAEALAGKK